MKKFYMIVGFFILALFITNVGYANNTIVFNGRFGGTAAFISRMVQISPNQSLEVTVTHHSNATRSAQLIPQRINPNGIWSNAGNTHTFTSGTASRTFVRTWNPQNLSGSGHYRLSFSAAPGSTNANTTNVGGSFRLINR